MVVKSDGTKWACQSCLKGHRVSGCNHTDRELTLVPKKGRPVTQCQHCRQERKKRSAHVSCDCGEVEKPHHSKEKCIHLREAEERAKAGLQEDHPVQSEERDTAHLAAVAEEQGCCCHHGGKCSLPSRKVQSRNLKMAITSLYIGETTWHMSPACRTRSPCLERTRMRMSKQRHDGRLTVLASQRTSRLTHLPLPLAKLVLSVAVEGCRSRNSRRQISMRPIPSLLALALLDSARHASKAVRCRRNPSRVSQIKHSTLGQASRTDNVGLSQPALTAASSGTQSEIDEISGIDDMYGFGMPSIQEDMSSTDFLGASGAGSPQSNRRSLPPDFLSVLPGTGSEWQPNESGFAASTAQTERKEAPGSGIMNFDNNMWQMPPLLPATELPYRQANFQSTMGQPFSQGFSAASRSGPDPFEELFPGMDCSGTGYSSLNNSQDQDSFSKSVPSNATSAPINFTPSTANGVSTVQTSMAIGHSSGFSSTSTSLPARALACLRRASNSSSIDVGIFERSGLPSFITRIAAWMRHFMGRDVCCLLALIYAHLAFLPSAAFSVQFQARIHPSRVISTTSLD
ncbi:hypothetical protein KC365_g61 [Hortaea werneckii]|nr:hypothetical protein KC365_g61 [Hortaea werneckii]